MKINPNKEEAKDFDAMALAAIWLKMLVTLVIYIAVVALLAYGAEAFIQNHQSWR